MVTETIINILRNYNANRNEKVTVIIKSIDVAKLNISASYLKY